MGNLDKITRANAQVWKFNIASPFSLADRNIEVLEILQVGNVKRKTKKVSIFVVYSFSLLKM